MGREEPRKRWIVVGAACGAGMLGLMLPWGGAVFALVGFGLVIVSNPEVFFPIDFEVSEERASRRCLLSVTEIAWENVRRVQPDDFGVKLSPLPKVSRLDAFRGVYLRYDDNEDAVLATIRSHTDGNEGILAGRLGRGGEGATGGEAGS